MWVDRVDSLDGAEGVQERLARHLVEPGKQIVVYGITGVGKTSLVEHACRAQELRFVRVQCGQTLDTMLTDALAEAGIFEERLEEVTKVSGHAGLTGSLFGLLTAGLRREDTDTARRVSFVSSISTATRNALQDAGFGVLFFDNLENAYEGGSEDGSPGGLRTEIARLLKVFANEGTVKVVVAGISREGDPLVPLDAATSRRTSEIVVPRMSDIELEQIVRAGEAQTGLIFHECRDDIIRASEGLPWKTHELALQAALEARHEGETRVTSLHFRRIRDRAAGAQSGSATEAPEGTRPPSGDHMELRSASDRSPVAASRSPDAEQTVEPDCAAVVDPREPDPSAWIIRDVMNPRFLLKQLHAVEEGVRKRNRQTVLPSSVYSEAYLGLEGLPADLPYMPRKPIDSILQSVLSFALTSRAEDRAELLEPAPLELRSIAHAVVRSSNILADFGPRSAQWIDQKLAECLAMLETDRRLPPPAVPADPISLAPDARLVLVGDWATALPGAIAVAAHMRSAVRDARKDGREVHVIHLGDVYYSGWSEEYDARFFPYWPVEVGEAGVWSWALAGNHDMYSAGHGYFGRVLRDRRFARQQGSSWFSLENEAWQVLGLDSSYLDQDLTEPQLEWVEQHVAEGSKHTMLLSHHPPIHPAGSLMWKLQDALDAGGIEAWFWGHEHRCEVYQSGMHFNFGACVGHGGVPELGRQSGWMDGSEPMWTPSETERVGVHTRPLRGFAIVDFEGQTANAQFINEHGDSERQWRVG
jgi:hypothetical protein